MCCICTQFFLDKYLENNGKLSINWKIPGGFVYNFNPCNSNIPYHFHPYTEFGWAFINEEELMGGFEPGPGTFIVRGSNRQCGDVACTCCCLIIINCVTAPLCLLPSCLLFPAIGFYVYRKGTTPMIRVSRKWLCCGYSSTFSDVSEFSYDGSFEIQHSRGVWKSWGGHNAKSRVDIDNFVREVTRFFGKVNGYNTQFIEIQSVKREGNYDTQYAHEAVKNVHESMNVENAKPVIGGVAVDIRIIDADGNLQPLKAIEEDSSDLFRSLSCTYSPERNEFNRIGLTHNQTQLNCRGQWIPRDGNPIRGTDYLEIRLVDPKNTLLCGVVTRGRGDGKFRNSFYVTSYKLMVSRDDGNSWEWVESGHVFPGNFDDDTKVTTTFSPIACTAVRIYPETWEGYICLRAGILVYQPN